MATVIHEEAHRGLLGLGWLYDLWTLNEQVDERNREAAR